MNETRQPPPIARARDTLDAWRIECGPPRGWVFWMLAGSVAAGLATLPLVRLHETVRASGAVRPVEDPVEVRATAGGVIARVFVHDDAAVATGEPLCEIAAPELDERRRHLARRCAELDAVLADLSVLTVTDVPMAGAGGGAAPGRNGAAPEPPGEAVGAGAAASGRACAEETPGLVTPLYLSEWAQFQAASAAAEGEQRLLQRELARVERLHARGLVTERDFDQACAAMTQAEAEDCARRTQARARWHAQLRQVQRERADLETEDGALAEAQRRRVVRAPTGGDLLGFAGWKSGGFVTEGQPLGLISPAGALRIEAVVRSRDLAQLRAGKPPAWRSTPFPRPNGASSTARSRAWPATRAARAGRPSTGWSSA